MEKRDIEYSFNKELFWKDIGYPDDPADIPKEKEREHFQKCGHSCYSIDNGILYYCDVLYAAEVNTGYRNKEDDVVNIRKYLENHSEIETKIRMFQYLMGDIDGNGAGSPSFCRLCRGIGDDNEKLVEAGS